MQQKVARRRKERTEPGGKLCPQGGLRKSPRALAKKFVCQFCHDGLCPSTQPHTSRGHSPPPWALAPNNKQILIFWPPGLLLSMMILLLMHLLLGSATAAAAAPRPPPPPLVPPLKNTQNRRSPLGTNLASVTDWTAGECAIC